MASDNDLVPVYHHLFGCTGWVQRDLLATYYHLIAWLPNAPLPALWRKWPTKRSLALSVFMLAYWLAKPVRSTWRKTAR